jgi:regulator of sigma E protease
LQLAKFKDKPEKKPTAVGTSAALAKPSFEQGDTILKVGDTKVLGFTQLQDLLSRKRGETLEFLIQRDQASEDETKGEIVAISVKPNRFRTLGLWMGTGKIVAVKKGSPADVQGMRPGDRITRINDKIVGKDINPLRLPDYLAGLHGHAIRIMVSRPVEGGESKEEVILIDSLLDKPGWVERPIMPGAPLSIPALGVAFHLIPNVLKVDEGSPAAKANIQSGEIQKMEFILPEGTPFDGFKNRENGDERVFAIEFKDKDGKPVLNWAYAFWTMQSTPTRTVRLTINNAGETQIVEIEPRVPDNSDWFLPTRGIRMMPLKQTMKAGSIFETLQMGVMHTRNSISDIYLTLRNLVSGDLSYKELHGPLGIAVVAYEFASQGLAKLSLFLGLLSINLAVLNFLPIPVLDGGHMVFLTWEGITRKRPSERVLVAATYFGMAFVLGLMILVLYLDIVVHGMGVN